MKNDELDLVLERFANAGRSVPMPLRVVFGPGRIPEYLISEEMQAEIDERIEHIIEDL